MDRGAAIAALGTLAAARTVQRTVASLNTEVLKAAFEERGRRPFLDDIVIVRRGPGGESRSGSSRVVRRPGCDGLPRTPGTYSPACHRRYCPGFRRGARNRSIRGAACARWVSAR